MATDDTTVKKAPVEYYLEGWGEYVTPYKKIEGDTEHIVVNSDDGLKVVRVSDLKPKEKSYRYQQQKKREEELQLMTAKAQQNFDRIVEKVIKKACDELSTRMKLNAMFGKNMSGSSAWAVVVADELKKLVKEDAKRVVEDEK